MGCSLFLLVSQSEGYFLPTTSTSWASEMPFYLGHFLPISQSFNFICQLLRTCKSFHEPNLNSFPFIQRWYRKDYHRVQFRSQLARKGNQVGLVDLDIYAPSIQTYFEIEPKKWLNNYLNSSSDLSDVIVDGSQFVKSGKINPGDYNPKGKSTNTDGGNLWLGFSNPSSEEVLQLETTGTSTC